MKIALFFTSLFGMVLLIASIWVGFSEFEDTTTTSRIAQSIKKFISNLFKSEPINKLMSERFILAKLGLALVLIFGLASIMINLFK